MNQGLSDASKKYPPTRPIFAFYRLLRRWSVMVYVKSKPWANPHPACVLFSISCLISCCEISNVWFGYIDGWVPPPPPPGEVIRCPPLPQYNVLSSIKIGPKDGLNDCVLCVKCHYYFYKLKKQAMTGQFFCEKKIVFFLEKSFQWLIQY